MQCLSPPARKPRVDTRQSSYVPGKNFCLILSSTIARKDRLFSNLRTSCAASSGLKTLPSSVSKMTSARRARVGRRSHPRGFQLTSPRAETKGKRVLPRMSKSNMWVVRNNRLRVPIVTFKTRLHTFVSHRQKPTQTGDRVVCRQLKRKRKVFSIDGALPFCQRIQPLIGEYINFHSHIRTFMNLSDQPIKGDMRCVRRRSLYE